MTAEGPRDPLRRLRDQAQQSGLPTSPTPEESGVTLDSPNDLIAALRAKHGPLQPGPAGADPVSLDRKRRQRLGRLIAAGSVAAATALLLILQPWSTQVASADEPPVLDYEFAAAADIANAPGRAANTQLAALAEAADGQAATGGEGKVQHVVTDNWFAELTSSGGEASEGLIVPTYRETWLRADGSVVVTEDDGQPLSADGRTEPNDQRSTDAIFEELPAGTTEATLVSGLPREPAAMRLALLEIGGCADGVDPESAATCLLQVVADIHTTHVVPPEASAAIWNALSTQPNLTTLGTVSDRLGRSGVGITLPPGRSDFRIVLIASPDTGALLGTETILIRESEDLNLESPAIFSFTAVVSAEFAEDASIPLRAADDNP